MGTIKDHTAIMPFILFTLFAGIVIYAIVKGTPKKLTKEQIEEIYKKTETEKQS